MLFFKKTSSESQKGYVPHEEIDAKKTSKLGYFFLLLMVFFGVWQGNNLLGAIKNSIERPENNSSCYYALVSAYNNKHSNNQIEVRRSYDYYGYYSNDDALPAEKCAYSNREKLSSIPQLYLQVLPLFEKRKVIVSDLGDVRSRISNLQYNRSQAIDEYSVSLLENIARKDSVLDGETIRKTIKTSDDLLKSLQGAQGTLLTKQEEIETSIGDIIARQKQRLVSVSDSYDHDQNVYMFKSFVVSLLLVLPVFLFAWKRYWRSKNARSEYAIIWGGILAIASIMLAQVLLVFIYEILPHRLLQKIFAFFQAFEFMFVVLYWLGFILVPLFFGGLIYFIQKKYYNKKAVVVRAFKANKCPTCSMAVASHMAFCPMCGVTLKTKCASCGMYSPDAGNYCELCGVKKREDAGA